MYASDAAHRQRDFGRIYPPRLAWLAAQAPEPILEPDLAIVDPHFHFIDRPGFRYRADELSADLDSGHRVEATVYQELPIAYRTIGPVAMRPVGETEFVIRETTGLARLATGIVGYADLMLGAAVEDVLGAHVDAGSGRLKGIRYVTALDSNSAIDVHHRTRPSVMRETTFHDAIRVLEKMDLSLDAFVFFHQLPEVTALARAHPGLNLIVGHCGGPLGYGPYAGQQREVFAQWRTHMTALAECPNVSIKLAVVLTRLAAQDYLNSKAPASSETLAACMRPYIETCIELFGAERCMFEGNFPIEKMVTGYAALWNAFKRITADATPTEKRLLYSGTAKRVYRIA